MGGTIAIIIISIIEPVFRAKKERGNNKNSCQYDQDYLDIYHRLFLTAIFLSILSCFSNLGSI